MKITKIQNHGKVRYRVNDPNGSDGRRQRKFFETREDAEQYIKDRKQDTRTFGVHFVTIPPAQRAVINHQLDRLKQLGWTLSAAVDCRATRRPLYALSELERFLRETKAVAKGALASQDFPSAVACASDNAGAAVNQKQKEQME